MNQNFIKVTSFNLVNPSTLRSYHIVNYFKLHKNWYLTTNELVAYLRKNFGDTNDKSPLTRLLVQMEAHQYVELYTVKELITNYPEHFLSGDIGKKFSLLNGNTGIIMEGKKSNNLINKIKNEYKILGKLL